MQYKAISLVPVAPLRLNEGHSFFGWGGYFPFAVTWRLDTWQPWASAYIGQHSG